MRDCNENLAPRRWVGDGTCDQKSRRYGVHYIDLACAAFNYDNADCATLDHSTYYDDDDGTAISAAARRANVTCDGGLYYCCDYLANSDGCDGTCIANDDRYMALNNNL